MFDFEEELQNSLLFKPTQEIDSPHGPDNDESTITRALIVDDNVFHNLAIKEMMKQLSIEADTA